MASRSKRIRERYEDKRLDWRDPDMPVLRRLEKDDGKVVVESIPAQEEQAFHVQKMRWAAALQGWEDDPLYNARRRGRRSSKL